MASDAATSSWEVVDGVQRLSTLVQFAGEDEGRGVVNIKEPLKLVELEKLGQMNEHTFSSLPMSVKTHFLTRPIKVTVLADTSDDIDDIVKYDLFALTQQAHHQGTRSSPSDDNDNTDPASYWSIFCIGGLTASDTWSLS